MEIFSDYSFFFFFGGFSILFLQGVRKKTRSIIWEKTDPIFTFFFPFFFLELQALHEMVQQKVVTLLSDPENIVKQTLMENGITRLCVFFGRQKANDVLLSHMITFLNDKNDWHLRGAFFDSIVGMFFYLF